jgi:hypothetical protein
MTDEYRLPPPLPGSATTLSAAESNAASDARNERINAAIAERQQEEAADARAKEERLRSDGAAALASFRERTLVSFLRNGGGEGDFDRAWPGLRQQYLAERATSVSPREQLVQQTITELRKQSPDGL